MGLFASIVQVVDKQKTEDALKKLFIDTFGESPDSIHPLSAHASSRTMFRLHSTKHTAIGVFHAAIGENEAFFYFTKIFKSLGLSVPELYAISDDRLFYLEEDLGDETLMDLLKRSKTPNIELLKEVLSALLRFQIEGAQKIDFNKSFPVTSFDGASIKKDLMYFKREFLHRTTLTLSGDVFERGAQELVDTISACKSTYFLYRDFQTRNIMVKDGRPFFIDYQGGRQGALQYDVASILFQSQAKFSENLRETLLEHYLSTLSLKYGVPRESFLEFYPHFVFLRLIQVLATYGVHGLGAQKKYFLESIPLALNNMKVLHEKGFFGPLPTYFQDLIKEMLSRYDQGALLMTKPAQFTVHIFSFSFRDGKVPEDPAKNGGGYVFDCRLLPNPGRDPAFQNLTGQGDEVKHFLQGNEEVEDFFTRVHEMVHLSISSYKKRGFTDLMVSFGCTGGQHRSVYFAERLATTLAQEGVRTELKHTQLPILGLLK